MTDKTRLFKEEINNIPIPTEKLDEIIFNTVKGDKYKRKKSTQKKIFYSFSAVAITFILLTSSATTSPVMANIVSKIPIIGTVFSESGDQGLELVNEQGLTNKLGATKSVGQTSITLDEIYYDETRLAIGFSITSEQPIEESYLSAGPNITINGKVFSNASTYKETEISPMARTGILNIDSFDDLPETFSLGVTFTGKDGKQWDFSTPVSKKSTVQLISINHTQEVENVEVTVSDIKVSPAGLQFSFSANSEQINFINAYLDFKVIDDAGNELLSHSGASKIEEVDGTEYYTGERLIDPPKESVKKLTVIPYIRFSSVVTSVEVGLEGKESNPVTKTFWESDIDFESFTVTLP